MNRVTRAVGWILMLSLMGCGGGGEGGGPEEEESVDYRTLDPNADAVRTAFNQDAGKVRAIFLASPT